MPKRETESAPASVAPSTPRASGERRTEASAAGDVARPGNSTRPPQAEGLAVASEPGDTLLSAGKPADRVELLVEDRLVEVDERLHEVDERLHEVDERLHEVDERLHEVDSRLLVVERKKSLAAPERRQKPWVWFAFLIAFVVIFQLLLRALRQPLDHSNQARGCRGVGRCSSESPPKFHALQSVHPTSRVAPHSAALGDHQNPSQLFCAFTCRGRGLGDV